MSKRNQGGTNKVAILLGVAFICMIGVGISYVMFPGLYQSVLSDLVERDQVIVTGYVREFGGAHANAANSPIYVFDSDMVFLEAPTSATGLYTIGMMLYEGTVLKIQVRQAAPLTADPYLSVLETRTVPNAGPGDTVIIPVIYVYDATGTAPLLNCTDQSGNNIYYRSSYFINTTDTMITIHMSGADADTAWGGVETRDYATANDDRWSGPVFVWTGTAAQSWATAPDWTISDPTNIYYVWRLPQLFDSTADATDDITTKSITTVAGFAADPTVTLDAYSTVLLDLNGNIVVGNLVDGAGGSITVLTTRVG